MELPEHASADELAALLGITQQRVSALLKAGVLIRPKRGAYPLAENVGRYCAHLRETASGRGGQDGVSELTAERARLAREQADRQALKNAELRGELVRADAVRERWEDVARTARARLLAIPSRIRGRLALSQDQVAILDREVRDALEGLADGGP
ncbi:MAG: DNA packaging protein [Pseudomonadota bacterium]